MLEIIRSADARHATGPGNCAAERTKEWFLGAANIARGYMAENADFLLDEWKIAGGDVLLRKSSPLSLLHIMICVCLAAAGHPELDRTADSFRSVAEQNLVMSHLPIGRYAASDLRDALWCLALRWRKVMINRDVVLYLRTLEGFYAGLLRTSRGTGTHDVETMREHAVPDCDRQFVCSHRMILWTSAVFAGIEETLWMRGLFRAAEVDARGYAATSADRFLPAARAMMGVLVRFCAATRNLSRLQQSYCSHAVERSPRPGEREFFIPEHPLQQVRASNVILYCRGSEGHASVQMTSSRGIRTVLEDVLRRLDGWERQPEFPLEWNEEAAVICAADMMLKKTVGIDWWSDYVVPREKFRELWRKNFFAISPRPVLVDGLGRFAVVHRGIAYDTGCLPANVVLWIRVAVKSVVSDRRLSDLLQRLDDQSECQFLSADVTGELRWTPLHTADRTDGLPAPE